MDQSSKVAFLTKGTIQLSYILRAFYNKINRHTIYQVEAEINIFS